MPARSTREGGSDQIYASVVTTMLSLMDGVKDRGSVVVIAATNRYNLSIFHHDPRQLGWKAGPNDYIGCNILCKCHTEIDLKLISQNKD